MRSAWPLGGVVLPELGVGVRAVAQVVAAGTAACRRRAPAAGCDAVKSVAMPMTWSGAMPAAATAAGTAVAQRPRSSRRGPAAPTAAGSRAPMAGSVRSMTPLRVLVHRRAELRAVARRARRRRAPRASRSRRRSRIRPRPPRPWLNPRRLGPLGARAGTRRRRSRSAPPPRSPTVGLSSEITPSWIRQTRSHAVKHVDVVVQHHDHRDPALLLEAGDQVEDERALLGAHGGERLVEQQDVGLGVHGPSDRDRLTLTAGQARDRAR